MMWNEGEVPVHMNAERRFSWRASVGGALLLAMACPASASAGNIFMKNGYIIQGRIVDRDVDSVILGWPNGKVSIARRFVESVEYEHAEEERIRELERARQEQPEEDDSFEVSALAESTDEGDLPPSLEMFIQKFQLEPLKHSRPVVDDPLELPVVDTTGLTDSGVEDPIVEDPTDGSGSVDPVPDAHLVDREILAADAVESDSAFLAMRPAKTWSQQFRTGFLAFTSDEGGDVRSSINVVSMDRGSLNGEEFVELLREQQRTELVAFEMLAEGATQVGGRDAYELSGRCSYENQPAVVRQIIVQIAGRVWLFSAFAPDDSDAMVDRTMEIVDAMLETVTFRTGVSEALEALEDGVSTEDSVDDMDTTTREGTSVNVDDVDLDDMDLDDVDDMDFGDMDLDDMDLDDMGFDDMDFDADL